MNAWVWFGVAVLGGVGANARFVVHVLLTARRAGELPLGTLAVNVSGSLLLGVLVGRSLGGDALLLAGTATLGSYTTFSTWMLETWRLAAGRRRAVALLNVLASLGLGFGAIALGNAIGAAL
jgi:CrcB protein